MPNIDIIEGRSSRLTEGCTMRLLLTYAISLLILTACAMNPARAMNLRANVNPFKSYGATAYFKSECTTKINGDCVAAKCKQDAESNCDVWAAGCLKNDGYFKGSSEGGTCSKIM